MRRILDAENIGSSGIGIFKNKTGNILNFKKLINGSNKVIITETNNNVIIDIIEPSVNNQDVSILNYREIDKDTEINKEDAFIAYDTTNGELKIILPAARDIVKGKLFYFKDRSGNGARSPAIIIPMESDTIEHEKELVLRNGNDYLILICNGKDNYMILN